MISYYSILIVSTVVAKLSRAWPSVGSDGRGLKSVSCYDKPSTLTPVDLLLIFILAIFSGARYGVGTDFPVYLNIYSDIDVADWTRSITESPQEIGYTIFSLATKLIFDDPFAIFWTSSFVTVAIMIVRLKKVKGSFTLAVFLYISLAYYVAPFNIVRQGIAICLVFWADSFYEKSKAKFWCLVLLASSFHVSALFFLVGYLIARKIKPSVKMLFLTVFISGLFAAIFIRAPQIGTFLSFFNERYESSLKSEGAGLGTVLSIVFRLSIILYIFILNRSKPSNNNYYLTLAILGVAFTIMGLELKLAARIGTYFGIFIIPALVETVARHNDKIVHYYLITVAGLIYFTAHLLNYGELVPYISQLSYWTHSSGF